MNFKIGDKVRFLNEKGEGVVSKIINKTTVGITIDGDFEIPFSISQLLIIRDELNPPKTEKTSIEKESFIEKKNAISSVKKIEKEGIYIAFSPENSNNISYSDFNVWLINNTKYEILFSYSIFSSNGFKTIETGSLVSTEHLLIETIDQKLLSDSSTFKIDALFFEEKEHEYQIPISEVIKLKPIKLYKENAFVENSFISDKALIITVSRLYSFEEKATSELLKTDLSKIFFQKKNLSDTPKKSKPHANNNSALEIEIDLHIEELIDNYSGMTNAEIVIIQIKHFQKALDNAINNHFRKLVVIHGVGNGRLKNEVRSILSTYSNLKVLDASYSKYGFGATEVLIN